MNDTPPDAMFEANHTHLSPRVCLLSGAAILVVWLLALACLMFWTDRSAKPDMARSVYIILVTVLVFPTALILFGALPSHAEAEGNHYGISWNLAGPAAAMLGCALLGYFTVPSNPEFTLSVDIVGTNGQLDPHAEAGLSFHPPGTPEIFAPIRGTIATFPQLSPQLRNSPVYVALKSFLYEVEHPRDSIKVSNDRATVQVKLKSQELQKLLDLRDEVIRTITSLDRVPNSKERVADLMDSYITVATKQVDSPTAQQAQLMNELWEFIVSAAQTSRTEIVRGCQKTIDYDNDQARSAPDNSSTTSALGCQPAPQERLIGTIADCGKSPAVPILMAPAGSYFAGIRRDLIRLTAVDDDIADCKSKTPSAENVKLWKEIIEYFRNDFNKRVADLNAEVRLLSPAAVP